MPQRRLLRPKTYDLTQTRGFPAVRSGNVICVPQEVFFRWSEAQAMSRG